MKLDCCDEGWKPKENHAKKDRSENADALDYNGVHEKRTIEGKKTSVPPWRGPERYVGKRNSPALESCRPRPSVEIVCSIVRQDGGSIKLPCPHCRGGEEGGGDEIWIRGKKSAVVWNLYLEGGGKALRLHGLNYESWLWRERRGGWRNPTISGLH